MHIFTTGTQAISGASAGAGGVPIPVSDPTKPTRSVYELNLQTGFAYTGGGTWDTLIAAAAIPANATEMEVFLAGADDVDIGFGAPAAETGNFKVIPGGNGRIPISVTAGARVAIRGNGAGGTTGILIINFYGP